MSGDLIDCLCYHERIDGKSIPRFPGLLVNNNWFLKKFFMINVFHQLQAIKSMAEHSHSNNLPGRNFNSASLGDF